MTVQLRGGFSAEDPRLDRLPPSDWKHTEKYPLRAILPQTVASVERTLSLPDYRAKLDQGWEGACVGFSAGWMMGILNRRYYDSRWLYHEAQKIDEWEGEDYDGTSVRAGLEILRTVGHRRIFKGVSEEPQLVHGVEVYRWATTVDEIRTCIAAGVPVQLGVWWYRNFSTPEGTGLVKWIGKGDLGPIDGGHAICCYAASDSRQAVKLVNTWGKDWPLVWLPYSTLERLLDEDGEAALVTDR